MATISSHSVKQEKKTSFSLKGTIIWLICALMSCYEFMLSNLVGTFQAEMIVDFKLSSFQFSLLSSTIFLAVFGLMQLPAGFFIERHGLKKALLLSSLCLVFSCIMMANAHHYVYALMSRGLMGFGASFCLICLLVSVKQYLPDRYQATFIGISQFIGTLGPLVAAGPMVFISNTLHYSWRSIFLHLSCFGFVMFMLIVIFLESESKQVASQFNSKYIAILKQRLQKYAPWIIAVTSASLSFVARYFPMSEGRLLVESHGVSPLSSGNIISMIWLGFALGGPVLGYLSDRFKNRQNILIGCSVILLTVLVFIFYFPHPRYFYILFFLLGWVASGQCVCLDLMARHFKVDAVATGFALHNLMVTFSIALISPLLGLLLDFTLSAGVFDKYTLVMGVLLLISFIPLVASLFFIEDRSKQYS
jgi:MFS family permease